MYCVSPTKCLQFLGTKYEDKQKQFYYNKFQTLNAEEKIYILQLHKTNLASKFVVDSFVACRIGTKSMELKATINRFPGEELGFLLSCTDGAAAKGTKLSSNLINALEETYELLKCTTASHECRNQNLQMNVRVPNFSSSLPN